MLFPSNSYHIYRIRSNFQMKKVLKILSTTIWEILYIGKFLRGKFSESLPMNQMVWKHLVNLLGGPQLFHSI